MVLKINLVTPKSHIIITYYLLTEKASLRFMLFRLHN